MGADLARSGEELSPLAQIEPRDEHVMVNRTLVIAVLSLAGSSVMSVNAGCGSSTTTDSSPAGQLREATGVDWLVEEDPTVHTVWFAMPRSGAVALPAGASVGDSLLAFLEANARALGMTDPSRELHLESAATEEDGATHLRFTQSIGGVPVEGARWTAQINAAGQLESMSGLYVPNLGRLRTRPELSREAAVGAARDDVVKRRPDLAGAIPSATTDLEVFVRDDGTPVLAYRVRLTIAGSTGPGERAIYQIDADSGRVLTHMPAIRTATATGYGAAHYPPFNRSEGMKSFPVDASTPPKLDGMTQGVRIRTFVKGTDSPVTATSTSPWVDGLLPQGQAVDAQAHASLVVSFYAKLRYGGKPWLSYDGRASPVNMVLKDNEAGPYNAYWDAEDRRLHFGEGEPSAGTLPKATLNTVAHEFSHGVGEYTSGLYFRGEPGAIEESFADVFASFVDHALGKDDEAAFNYSEDNDADGIPTRSLVHPGASAVKTPAFDHVSQWAAGGKAHTGSGIPSNAFYLLTHGGTNDTSKRRVRCGIGWSAALKLYWALRTSYVLPGETFQKLAIHSLTAAKRLRINVEPVGCAWAAVGAIDDAKLQRDWNVKCPEASEANESETSTTHVSPATALLECTSVNLLDPPVQ